MLPEAPRDLLVGGVEAQRQVGGEHCRPLLLRRIVSVRDRFGTVLGDPLVGAGGALGEFPFVAEEVLKEAVAPLRRRAGPGDFQAARDRIAALAATEAVLPAQSLVLKIGRLGFGTHVVGRTGSVRLAKRVATRNQRDGFLV